MNTLLKHYFRMVFCLTAFFVAMLGPCVCRGHNENLHKRMTTNAFESSSGLASFLIENSVSQSLTAYPPKCGGTKSARDWLGEGSYYEDMEDLFERRCLDHFYTVQEQRAPGQVIGLTDWSEPILVADVAHVKGYTTNSFAWGTSPGIKPPDATWTNAYKWSDARQYEFAALTSTNQFARETNMALMFYSLGHVLHLNQDLTSPDHVRDAAHFSTAYFEIYGKTHFNDSQNQKWFAAPTNREWAYWQSQGFTNLLNFWDCNKYNQASESDGLEYDETPGGKLGLAEFSNGNFLGGTALYKECYTAGDIHSFPFPSLISSTSYPFKDEIASYLDSHLRTNFLSDGGVNPQGCLVPRVYVDKIGDGITFSNHSALSYLGAAYALRGSPPRLAKLVPAVNRVSVSIHDNKVLQTYHDILIPKAVEYSTGILDYFFRGTMDVTVSWGGTNAPNFTNTVLNTSGQDFHGGAFFLFADATNGTRTQILQTNLADLLQDPDASFTSGTTLDILCDSAPTNKLLLVYQGAIGWTNNAALDLVDSNICIAAARPWIKQIKTYDAYRPGTSEVGATIATNLESDDFDFTLAAGNYEVKVNYARFDDTGTIGGLRPTSGGSYCSTWTNEISNVIVPMDQVTVVSNHLSVPVTAKDDPNCGNCVGWWTITITWCAWPAPQ
jgi:hypothetical protein